MNENIINDGTIATEPSHIKVILILLSINIQYIIFIKNLSNLLLTMLNIACILSVFIIFKAALY